MNILEKLVSWYAPHNCAGCQRDGEVLCAECIGRLAAPDARCYRCHRPVAGSLTCPRCRTHGLQAVRAVTRYDQAAKAAVWRLKFERARSAAESMGQPMAALCRGRIGPQTLIVPVPTARSRVRRRGYDQASVLARSVARHAGGRYAALLWRLGHQRQVGAGLVQRRSQLQGAFRLAGRRRLHGKHIILVDDVVTTGSTLEAAARVLLLAGAASVEAVVFAQAGGPRADC